MSVNVSKNPTSEVNPLTENRTEQKQDYQADNRIQDETQLKTLAQVLGVFIFYKTDRFVKVKNAFNTIKDPKLAEKLLDFGNPQELQAIHESLRVVDGKLSKKEVRRDKAEARFLFWHSEITADEFDRATRALAVARRVHHLVNTRSFDIKIQNQISRLGLEPKEALNFKASISKYLQDHPGQTVDSALIVETARIHRERKKLLAPYLIRINLFPQFQKHTELCFMWKQEKWRLKPQRFLYRRNPPACLTQKDWRILRQKVSKRRLTT
jgi:hypothetical protein